MTIHVVLLRAVNVGGTGKLPMATLKALCEGAGLAQVETYIASGNVVGRSPAPPADVKAALEAALHARMGKPIGVIVRTGDELAELVAGNPFPAAPRNEVAVLFLEAAPSPDTIAEARGRVDETVALGRRELYIHYPSGMGRSKLKLPAASSGTARNMNTVVALADMAARRAQ